MMAARALQIGEFGGRVAGQVTVLRQRRGWDQARLARVVTEAGRTMSASVLGKVEAGTRRVDVDDLVALATALEVSPAELLGETAADERKPAAAGPVETAVRDDIEILGDLIDLEGTAPSLAQMAYRLAREMDYGGGEGGPALHSLAKELRAVLAELMACVPEEPPSDDDLDDLAAAD